jgi:hypothetical protein
MFKKIFLLLTVLFSINNFSQEITYKEYSYTDLFKMIEAEKDSVFTLENAIIKYNVKTDTLFLKNFNYALGDTADKHSKKLTINKHLRFNNVNFLTTNNQAGAIQNITFNKSVMLKEVGNFLFFNNTFNSEFSLINSEEYKDTLKQDEFRINSLSFCDFYSQVQINMHTNKNETNENELAIDNNNFYNTYAENKSIFDENIRVGTNSHFLFFYKNTIQSKGKVRITSYGSKGAMISENKFLETSAIIDIINSSNIDFLEISNNFFSDYVLLNIDRLQVNNIIDWKQFKGKSFSSNGYNNELNQVHKNKIKKLKIKGFLEAYFQNARITNKAAYKLENTLKGVFYAHYKEKMDNEYANMVYTELKDLETNRSEYLYEQNPSFKTFFKWRINQFLKVFSAYGTEPERAVVFSMYVILLFAFVYLLFPNSWDSHGKNRLMHRFEFYQKYLRRKEGMHTIYLEGKQEEISSYEDFKTNLENSKTELPAFFVSWSKPLYNASMFSSKLTAKFLQNTDILKGKWQDLSPKQKRFKNIQIGFLLLLGLLYDLCIKALNALMLSINTFTTLGFGEIPIKGLPRYLAIIQGFIGWFMLTIFSVSLISQLLN